jgi:predicted Zn finger-like uncharacterized protein
VKISCPACSAKYSIADDKVQDRLAKIRCRKCGATIVIDGKAHPPHVYTSASEAADPAETDAGGVEYSVDFGEGDQRTLPLRELLSAYNSGQITGETFVWADGFADWKPLSEVPEIVEALNASSAGPATSAAPSPWDRPGAAGATARPTVKASAPRAAARTAGRSATADLFGGIDTAGSEDEVATSAPEQHSPIGTPSNASATGARNESSVLFSLSALTSAAQTQTRPAPARSSSNGSSRDDSGLIDLKALTAAAMRNEATGAPPAVATAMAAMAPISPLGVAPPLGMAPAGFGQMPIGGSVDLGMPQQKSKAPIFIGAGLAIGLLGIAAAILLKPQPPPPPPAPVIVAAPLPAPAPAPTPAEAVAKPPSTGPSEAASEPSAKATPTTPRRYTGAVAPKKANTGSASGSSGETKSETKPTTPAPKRSSCGCAPTDLVCNMKCSAK